MVTSKEAIPASYQPAETLRGEQNSFLCFIDQNKDMFKKHSSLTYELRDEERGWRDSLTIDSIIKMNVELTLLLSPGLNNISSKTMRKLTEKARITTIDLVFGNSNEKDEFMDKMFPSVLGAKFRYTPKSKASIEILEESFNDVRTSFREAISPLVIGVRESKAELTKKFEDFLLSNSSNLFAFQDFISDKKNYGADREAIRPFLASLVETERILVRDKKEGILHRSVEKWVNELKENPTPDTIDEFTASIKSPNVIEWLEFAAHMPIKAPRTIEERDKDLIKDIADFLKSRPDVSTWPSELKDALSSFASSRYYSSLSSVGRDLEQFGRPVSLKSISLRIDPESEEKIEKVNAKVGIEKKPYNKKGKLEKAEKEIYPVGILSTVIGSSFKVRVLTEEELTGRLQKEADSLDPSDSRMTEDLKNIFTNLQKDPYGLGTKKLTDKFVGVGNRSLPLRSINPGKRIGLSLDHPESTGIRIVYVIYRNEDGPVIGIEGIYKHEDYDKKFIS